MEQNMFCYQCQETARCQGCTVSGVCGKKPDVAAMQDLLVDVTRGLAAVTTALRVQGAAVDPAVNHQITYSLFVTITNANFDKEAIRADIQAVMDRKAQLLPQVQDPAALPAAARWDGARGLGGEG